MSASTTAANPLASQSLNQADFLKLLVTQMSSQDPLNPESDTEFAAQLAQFSSLQATQTMSGNLQTIQATGLLGQTVAVTPSTGGNPVAGVVTGVEIASGTPEIIVNGQAYTLSQLVAVRPTPTAPASTTPGSTTPPATTPPRTTPSSNTGSTTNSTSY
jgi:flagellar basal-body rod modification protein FlgD